MLGLAYWTVHQLNYPQGVWPLRNELASRYCLLISYVLDVQACPRAAFGILNMNQLVQHESACLEAASGALGQLVQAAR